MTDEEFEREKERDKEIEERRGKKDSSRSRSRCAPHAITALSCNSTSSILYQHFYPVPAHLLSIFYSI